MAPSLSFCRALAWPWHKVVILSEWTLPTTIFLKYSCEKMCHGVIFTSFLFLSENYYISFDYIKMLKSYVANMWTLCSSITLLIPLRFGHTAVCLSTSTSSYKINYFIHFNYWQLFSWLLLFRHHWISHQNFLSWFVIHLPIIMWHYNAILQFNNTICLFVAVVASSSMICNSSS